MPVTIEDVKRLVVRPGEQLVVTLPADTTPRQFEEVTELLKGKFPEGAVLVTTSNISLQVVVVEDEDPGAQ